MKIEYQIHEAEQVVENVAAFIASSNNRHRARVVIHNAIERRIQEIDIEASKYLTPTDVVDTRISHNGYAK